MAIEDGAAADEALMRELHDAVRAREAVPDRARDAARAAFAWRSIDAELLALTHDALAEAEALVRASGDEPAPRILSFEAAGISLEVEISAEQLVGQLLPGAPGRITLESPQAPSVTVDLDDTGFFEFRKPPLGPVRLRLDASGRRLTTSWVLS